MTALVIVGLLLAVGLPAYSEYIKRIKMAEAYVMIDGVQKAQTKSYFDNKYFVSRAHLSPSNGSLYNMPATGSKSSLSLFTAFGGSANNFLGSSSIENHYGPFKNLVPENSNYYFSYHVYSGSFSSSGIPVAMTGATNNGTMMELVFASQPNYQITPVFTSMSGSRTSQVCDVPSLGLTQAGIAASPNESFSVVLAGSMTSLEECSVLMSVMETSQGEVSRRPISQLGSYGMSSIR
jgi:Tfp pilus assembly protein PilE